MAYQEMIDGGAEKFESAITNFARECTKLRTGRANASLVDELNVDYYGTPTPLKQVANITIPEARQIHIQPWDKSTMELIEVAIKKSDIGIAPSSDGDSIRLTLPPMTEENRIDLVKVLNQKAEEARIGVRGVREDIWNAIQKEQKEGVISEDEKFAGKDALQKVVDGFIGQIDEMRAKKETDITTV